MHYSLHRAACSIAVAAAFPAMLASGSALAAPSVYFAAPRSGNTISGTIQSSACEARGSNIDRVRFYLDSTALNTEENSPWNCALDTRKFSDGSHTLRAVAYDSSGVSRSTQIGVTIKNGTVSSSGPAVSWNAPSSGATLSGNIQQSTSTCQVSGSGIARVVFFMDSTQLNTELSAPYLCNVDTTKFANGAHTLKAVAYNSSGASTTITRAVTVQNGTSTPAPTPGGPTVSFSQPTSGATLKGNVYQTSACEVKGSGIAKVQFYLDSTALNTELNAPYLCNLDTTRFANGSHTLMAVASNASGSTTTQVAVKIDNSSSTTPPPPSSSAVDPADVINQARASVPFAQQSGYNTQVINKYLQANQIPETGIHGSVLSNGDSLRLGKVTDPRDSSKKALAFQVAPGDPLTSGSHRAEIKFPENMSYDKVYWIAFRHYVPDWGTFSTSDVAMIAMQLHTSGSQNSLSPAVQIDSRGGRTFWIDARGSTASVPSHSTSVSVRSPEMPIKFGQWVDFVLKVKLNTSGRGFVQAWVDGTQVFNHTGTVGYNGTRPYMKFGYYNWTDFKTPRKVLMRSPVVVADSTGSKYSADQIRSFIRSR